MSFEQVSDGESVSGILLDPPVVGRVAPWSTRRTAALVGIAVLMGVGAFVLLPGPSTATPATGSFLSLTGAQDVLKSTCQVQLFEHGRFDGKSSTFDAGKFTLSQLESKGVHNDWVSSLKVGPGCQARLFQHDHFTGKEATFTHGEYDHSAMVRKFENDQLSSLIVVGPGDGLVVEASTCIRPGGWCTHRGGTFRGDRDCDGDSIADLLCLTGETGVSFLGSASDCQRVFADSCP